MNAESQKKHTGQGSSPEWRDPRALDENALMFTTYAKRFRQDDCLRRQAVVAFLFA
jgi:hypothetical protein